MAGGQAAWRLVIHAGLDGATNMAIDEAILESYLAAAGPVPPTLRLYGWSPPALSLGARQPAGGAHDPAFLGAHRIDLVRRPTGGRAVLHEHERTYAVIGTLRGGPFGGGVTATYERIATALAGALRLLGVVCDEASRSVARDPGPLGPPICFDTPTAHEARVGGRKLIGSAQLRRRGAFLQHGSILLRADADRLGRAIGTTARAERFIDLDSILRRAVRTDEVDAAVRAAFESEFGVSLEPTDLTERERRLAEDLRRAKYADARWTYLV